MLRIKESEWQRFCENAEKLGYTKIEADTIKVYETSIRFGADEYVGYKLFSQVIKIKNRNIYYRIDDVFDIISALDYLYDLIQQGYVEKVEE